MSLNYGTLKTRLRTLAHRGTEIADEQLADFVRQAEGVIARELRCAEMLTRSTLTDSDRVTGGIYSLPDDYLEDRAFYTADDPAIELQKVGLGELRSHDSSIDPFFYCPLSSTEVEFRGTPGSSAVLTIIYYARPTTFSAESDVNAILTRHEDVYIDTALAALYVYTQDLELAQQRADAANRTIETLNEQASRLLSGARTQQAYNLSSYRSY